MAIEVGTAYISILPSTSKLAPAIRKELKDVEKETGRSGERSGSSFGKTLMGGVKKAVGVAGIGAAIVGGAAMKGGIDRLLQIEDAEAKLRGLGHTSKGVSKIMDNALAAVKGTSFGMGEAATTAAGAVAAGIKPGKELTQYLMTTADAATIAGVSMSEMGGVLNKVTTANVAYTEDLNMLADRGIPIYKWLQDEYGITGKAFKKFVAEGNIDAKTYRKVIEENIGGAALESGNTTRGAFKNMMASLSRIGANFLSAFGFGDLKGIFTGLMDLMAPLETKATEFGQTLRDTLVPAIKALVDFGVRAVKFAWDNRAALIALGTAVGIVALGMKVYALWNARAAIATKVMAAAQRLLNIAFWTSPIGMITAALALLVAGLVFAYMKSETFRKIVNKAWASIKVAIKTAWERGIKPALTAFWRFITGTLMPIIKRLWNNVVKPVFKFIGRAIKFAWDKVIKPAFKAWWFMVSKVLWPVLKFLWSKVVKPVFRYIGKWIKDSWNKEIKPALKSFWAFVNKTLVPVLRFLWNKVVKPVFTWIGDKIKKSWNGVIKPVFTALKNFIQKTLVPAFRKGVEKMGEIWNKLKNAAKTPVKFLVNTVYNNGLREMIGKLPGVATPGRVNLGFARGGWTGHGAMYEPAGIVHADEFVVRKKSRRKFEKNHPGYLDYLNLHGELPGFFLGGRVPTNAARVVRHGGYPWARWAGDINGPGNDYGQSVHAWKAGTVSAVNHWNHSYGKHVRINHGAERTLYAHLSSILVNAGQRVGAGQIIGRLGSTGNSSGPHLHFELAGGSDPLTIGGMGLSGGRAVPKPPKMAGGFRVTSWLSAIDDVKDLIGKVKGWISGMGNSGWAGIFKDSAKGLGRQVIQWLNDKIPNKFLPDNPIPGIFDNGGILEPGALAYNASKKPEAVFNHRQFKTYAEGAPGTGRPKRVELVVGDRRFEAFMREVADNSVEGARSRSATLARMKGGR